MTRHHITARRAASAAALLAAAGLTVAGCKSSATASGTASSPGTGGSSSASSGSGSGGSGSGGSSSGSGGAASTFFPVGAGNTWVYTTRLSAISHGTITNKMTRVVPVAGGQRVTMEVLNNATGTATTKSTLSYIFNSDGSITVPFTQIGGGSVKVLSGRIVWPSASELASGQQEHSTLTFMVTEDGHVSRVTSRVTVQGKGSQTVTVPAGTYDAQVIDESFGEKVEGVSFSLRLVTWVANGVGPVKSELLSLGVVGSANSGPSDVEELKSFTKG